MRVCLLLLLAVCVLPIVVGVVVSRRTGGVKPLLLGGACFAVTQLCIRLPLVHHLLPRWVPYILFRDMYPVAHLVLLAVSAGVLEELGRILFLRWGKSSRFSHGVVFGLGHGGVEAVALVGLEAVALLAQPELLAAVSPSVVLFAALERVLAIAAHVGFSLIVLHSLRTHREWLHLPAILLHALLDFTAARLAMDGAGPWPVLGAAAALTAVIVLLALGLWRAGRKEEFS